MDFLDAIRRDSDLFYATAAGADPGAKVPTCPEWTVADLAWHLAEVHWFWATDVEDRATDPAQLEGKKPARPEGYEDLLAWGRAQAERLVQVLEATPDDVPVWTWALDEADHNVGFVRRHQVQEAAVHRWDMQKAVDSDGPDAIDAVAAADSVDEFLAITLPWVVKADKPLPGSVHLHCTDTEGEWFVEPGGAVARIHAKADVAIRGTASDLLLALYNRVDVGDLDVVGDESVARDLVGRVEGT
jgi:uncharacterized protein (TIGR03083 family)